MKYEIRNDDTINHLENALFLAILLSYTQGFQIISQASKDYHWDIDLAKVSSVWRNGCIIRASLLNDLKDQFSKISYSNLMFSEFNQEIVVSCSSSLRKIVSRAIEGGVPVPAFSSAINYLHSYTCETLSTNIIQAQRNHFGMHEIEFY